MQHFSCTVIMQSHWSAIFTEDSESRGSYYKTRAPASIACQSNSEPLGMPRNRIPISNTNEFRLRLLLMFEDASKQGISRSEFCRVHGIERVTLLTWESRRQTIEKAVKGGRARRLTAGGSGRISTTAPLEDQLVLWIKDRRRDELTVTRQLIVAECERLFPVVMGSRSVPAKLEWCNRFMRRHRLTIRRVTHSGRKQREEMLTERDKFVTRVLKCLVSDFFDQITRLPSAMVIYNMDQTSIYWNLGPNTTVDFVGVRTVPSVSSGKGAYRCTMALTVCSDGRMLPPHFVFKGTCGGNVDAEVQQYCDKETATFSVQRNVV